MTQQIDEMLTSILRHAQGGVEVLLELAGRQETDWLELKASLYPSDSDLQLHLNSDDYFYNVAHAAIAMANTRGGVILLGINDGGEPLGLSASDPSDMISRRGTEAFIRQVLIERVLCPAKPWNTHKHGRLQLSTSLLSGRVELSVLAFKGVQVAAIVVSPRMDGERPYIVTALDPPREFLPIRNRGMVGRVQDLYRIEDIREYERRPGPQHDDLRDVWETFSARISSSIASDDQAILRYHNAVRSRLNRLRHMFTSLTAAEDGTDLVPAWDLLVPQAEEVTHWLDLDNQWSPETEDAELDHTDVPPTVPVSEPKRLPVLEVLRQQHRSLLLGEPGAGKTTCLQRMCLESACTYRPGDKVTIFVPLSKFRGEPFLTFLEGVSGIASNVLAFLANAGHLCLLLDALNECPTQYYDEACNQLLRIISTSPLMSLVLSTRTATYNHRFNLPVYSVLPLDTQQQLDYLTTYLGSAEHARAIHRQLVSRPGGHQIASNPQLLSVVSSVVKAKRDLPRSRGLLYRQYMSAWYDREVKKATHAEAPLEWSWAQTLGALSLLAFTLRLRGKVDATIAEANGILSLTLAHPESFLRRLAQGMLFLADLTDNSFSFTHETIQEYLSAEHLVVNPKALEETLSGKPELWSMPIALMFELSAEVDSSTIQKAWHQDPFLVVVCVKDSQIISHLAAPPRLDAWERGVLNALSGKAVPETLEIANCSLSSAPPALRATLAGEMFWYSVYANEGGLERVNRFKRLMIDQPEPWVDLLPTALAGNPHWAFQFESVYGGVLALAKAGPPSEAEFMHFLLTSRKLPHQLQAWFIFSRFGSVFLQRSEAFDKMFFNGPWVSSPSTVSVRQWRMIIERGGIRVATLQRHRPLASYLLRQKALLPTLLRKGLITRDEFPKALEGLHLESLSDKDACFLTDNRIITSVTLPDSLRERWSRSADRRLAQTLVLNRVMRLGEFHTDVQNTLPTKLLRSTLIQLIAEQFSDQGRSIARSQAVGIDDAIAATRYDNGPPGSATNSNVACSDTILEQILYGSVESSQLDVQDVEFASTFLTATLTDTYDVACAVAAANVINAWLHRPNGRGATFGSEVLQFRDLIRGFFCEMARRTYQGVEIFHRAKEDMLYVSVFGLQFSFQGVVSPGTRDVLETSPMWAPQTWSGLRLKPKARLVLRWALRLRQEGRAGRTLLSGG